MKPIEGYKELYSVTDEGGVYSHRNDIILSCKDNGIGYRQVDLVSIEGKKKSYYVHRLVAFAFVDGYSEGLIVDHIDNNRSNNHPKNLQWITQSQNVKKYYDQGFESPAKKRIVQYTKDNIFVKEHASLKDAKFELGYIKPGSGSGISMCLKGKRNHAYGYIWNYLVP